MFETVVLDPSARIDPWHSDALDDLPLAPPASAVETCSHDPDAPLLDRDPELAVLCDRIALLRNDAAAGGCVLLSAEAGGGKTSLLVEVARRAGGRAREIGRAHV